MSSLDRASTVEDALQRIQEYALLHTQDVQTTHRLLDKLNNLIREEMLFEQRKRTRLQNRTRAK